MTNNSTRRVHKEYVELENIIKLKYKKAFNKMPSQMMTSRIIARLLKQKTIIMKKRGRKIRISVK